jgi:tellurite resistance protein
VNTIAGLADQAGPMLRDVNAPSPVQASIRNLPIALFTTVMGLGGLTIATEKWEQLLELPGVFSLVLLVVTALVWITVFVAYTAKLVRYPQSVQDDLNHPVRLSFFPAISIGLILIATGAHPYLPMLANALWWVAVAAQLGLTLMILNRWIHREHFQTEHNSPAWFIPIVANLLVPILGVQLGQVEISWFFFSIGIFFWLPLMAISLNRSFFFAPMPKKLLPTLFIFIVPPAIGFVSWTALHDGVPDDFGRILYYFSLFMTLMVMSQFRRFIGQPFALTWWAFSFPLAAITIATLAYFDHVPALFFLVFASSLYLVLVFMVVLLVVKTSLAVARKTILLPEV